MRGDDAGGLTAQLRAHGVTGPGPDYPRWLAEQITTSEWWARDVVGFYRLDGALGAVDLIEPPADDTDLPDTADNTSGGTAP